MTEPRLFTARYSNPNVGQSGLAAVGISRYSPRFRLPYRLEGNLQALAPTSTMLARRKNGSLTLEDFVREYEQQLERVGLQEILRRLVCLQGDAPGIVLLCFEDVTAGESCHRTMLAKWMKRCGGPMVTELADPGKKRPAKRPRPTGSAVSREARESRDEALGLVEDKSGLTTWPVERSPMTVAHPPCYFGMRAERAVLGRPRLSADLESEVGRVLVLWAVQILRVTREASGGI